MEQYSKIVNGQPQYVDFDPTGEGKRLGNRIVTWDGLKDFLAMLKGEIPRMGTGNRVEGEHSYAFGSQNSVIGSHGFVIGNANKSTGDFIAVVGNENGTDATPIGGEYVYITGYKNTIKGTTQIENLAIVGHENTIEAGVQNSKIIGDKNTIGYGFSHLQGGDDDGERIGHYENNYYVLGFENTVQGPTTEEHGPYEVAVIGGNNLIYNGSQCYVLGHNNTLGKGQPDETDTKIHDVFVLGMNLTSYEVGTRKREGPLYLLGQFNDYFDDDTLDYPNLAMLIGKGTSSSKPENLFALAYDGSMWINNGHMISPMEFGNKVFFLGRRENAKVYYGDRVVGSNGKVQTFPITMIDNTEDTGLHRSLLYHVKGFRHVLNPWNDTGANNYNEAIWNVRDRTNGDMEDTLHINSSNFRIPYLKDIATGEMIYSDTGGSRDEESGRYEYYAPKNIHFHAGKIDNWARLKCQGIIYPEREVKAYSFSSEGQVTFSTLSANTYYLFRIEGEPYPGFGPTQYTFTYWYSGYQEEETSQVFNFASAMKGRTDGKDVVVPLLIQCKLTCKENQITFTVTSCGPLGPDIPLYPGLIQSIPLCTGEA